LDSPDVKVMGSQARKTRTSFIDGELRSSVSRQSVNERLAEAVETASLKNISLEERRKEAGKPLFLTRYE
jgi:hypothetical protein